MLSAAKNKLTTSHTALPAHVAPSPIPATKRGHTRSASVENANGITSENTLGLPTLQPGHTGTLKSRNEQKRMRNRFGSHSNLEEFVQQGRSKFQNIRSIFEINRKCVERESVMLQSLPPNLGVVSAAPAAAPPANVATTAYQQQTQPQARVHLHTPQLQQQQSQQPQQMHVAYQQQYAAQQQQQAALRKPTPTTTASATGCGNNGSIADLSERLNMMDYMEASNKARQHQLLQSLQPLQPHQQQAKPLSQSQQQLQRSTSGLAHLQPDSENANKTTNLPRPIAFKPIPFEPDYSIPKRYCEVVGDRYGSTPSLAPVQGSSLRFGSSTDLRHGSGICSGGGCVNGGGFVGAYSSSNFCNSLMARQRGSRSLKINDSMESIRHTPDSDANSQASTIKSSCSNNNANVNDSSSSSGNKYILSGSEQCDMTPSPSDSGISELEAALKDRDSELSYLRQTMEHNEKDKEAFWENENKRLKVFYEGQQREYVLKIKKMEQMMAMQQFQFKQQKLRNIEQVNKLREQTAELKNDNEILRANNGSLKNSERNFKDRSAYIEEQLRESQNNVASLKTQLEESEWKICERNGELALLKSQLKEANVEITMKEHAIVHLKHENINAETQIYQSIQENQKITQQQKQVEEQKVQNQKKTQAELKQLNKIIILKDQVILALTNELAKLRKELSDLAIMHEYGEEPSGKFTRVKQQLDNLTDICNKTRRNTSQSELSVSAPKEKVVDDPNLEVIMNCLKLAPPLDDNKDQPEVSELSDEQSLTRMSVDMQNFVYGSQNLPDIAVNTNPKLTKYPRSLQESTLNTLIEESASYAEEIAKLRKQLDDVRVNFELEKRQWCEEKEKVLSYQKQLQAHYINMYQKLRSLENFNEI